MNPFELMKNFQGLQEKLTQAQGKIATVRERGQSGGGLVSVTMDGSFQVIAVEIDPKVLGPEDREVLADLLVLACKDAHGKVTKRIQSEMSIPDMFGQGTQIS